MGATKIVYYIIPLVVLVLLVMWQYGPSGLFVELKDTVKKITNTSIGSEKIIAGKPTTPAGEEESIKRLVDTIKTMAASSDKNCFLNYGGLPNLQGSSLTLRLKGDSMSVVIGGGAGGKQEVAYEEISGIRPCVIAGTASEAEKRIHPEISGTIPSTFYNNFLKEGALCPGCDGWNCPEGCAVPYWLKVSGITLSGNQIYYQDFTGRDNNQKLEDGGWIYKNNDGYVCFFPAAYFNSASGLNNKYLSGSEAGSIAYGIRHGIITLCSQDRWEKYQSIELFDRQTALPYEKVSQLCTGLIGSKDCQPDVTKTMGGSYLPQQEATQGCWVVATQKQLFNNQYASAEAVEGQIILPSSPHTPYEGSGNIQLVSGTIFGNEDAKKSLREKTWKSFSDKALLCLNHHWYVCRPGKVGEVLTVSNKKYNCTLENNVFTWRKYDG